ncbi:phage tail assembly chaperone [Pseudomonas sp. NPDC087342]|uniref:phage tail assembly chaperone n=1 Tax=Pseudomonas sp. NPDC087342 TaxID=3364437 RepID=UPI003821322E
MKIYWSPSTEGFFDSRINSVMPKDAVEVSPSYRDELIEGCRRNQIIVCRSNGFPILKEANPPTLEVSADAERQWRDGQLAATDAAVARHRDELEILGKTTLSAEQYAQLQAYRCNLRGWPDCKKFPNATDRPTLSDAGSVEVKKTRTRKKT